ncbi:chromatin target of PRMT1 protein-like isoform X2 [Plodia interpunctella]|uniref:chromatin target of PRMT1 protein-like isoform X2 n=1 Tax=Plodia interpunctella TaxID=58824 RepID=UPI0023681CBB|nr:chromatin target of PRMT1 protein-like isoform X2 [Plodia interpunctella]
MVIEKVHGLQATSMSLNDRFTLLASTTAPERNIRQQPRRRPSNGSVYNQNLTARNRYLIEQIARSLEWQRKRQALRQRIGQNQGRLRRFGSESSLPGLRRSNSHGNLSQNYHNFQNIKNRLNWRQSNGNLSQSASYVNVSGGAWRGFRRRALRGRFWGGRGGRINTGRVNRVQGRGRRRGQNMRLQKGRGRGRGMVRSQTPKPVPSKEELDAQLDQYMSGSKTALDRELEEYMRSAVELEGL